MDELSSYEAKRHCRRLVVIEGHVFGQARAYVFGRATADVGPRLALELPSSGASGIIANGGKCEHGVYIPAPYLSSNRAPDCSLCCPYEIGVREGLYQA